MKWVLTLAISSSILFSACEDRLPNVVSGNPVIDRKIQVNVYALGPIKSLNPVENALVEVYDERNDFYFRQDIYKFGYTDSSGRKEFSTVVPGYYYVVTRDSSNREKVDSVSVTSSSLISFVDIVYY